MKLLTDDKFALLTGQANAFIAIQTALVEASEDMTAEDITSETVIEALQGSVLQGALTETKTQLTKTEKLLAEQELALRTANDRIAELEAEMDELELTPAKKPATITPKSDGGDPDTIAEFADKNQGDTFAILERAKKEGLI